MRYVFDPYELDTSRYELRQGGELVPIEPKVFDLLLFLVQHRGEVITKEMLHEHLWPDQFVSDSALTYYIATGRKAIGDSGRTQRVIKTVYRRGYSFIAPVEERETSSPVQDVALTRPPDEPIQPSSSATEKVVSPQTDLEPEQTGLDIVGPELDTGRRQLTVMWCEITASPGSATTIDPEDLQESLQHIQRMFADIVAHHQGHIAQYSSHGLLVYFGYPLANEDDARRAVQAALDMRQMQQQLEQENLPLEPLIRIGIDTGIVVMGTVGSGDKREELALGEAPHIATELVGIASSNQVVVSNTTRRLIQGYFVFEDLGVLFSETLSQTIVAHLVQHESGVQSRIDAAATLTLTPFVGREQELYLLQERWQQVKVSTGQVALLSGDSGIGKSRLIHAFHERIANEVYTRIEWRCSPYYQHSAFAPIINDVQQAFGLQRSDTNSIKLAKLESSLRQMGFHLSTYVPLFATLLSLPHAEPTPLTAQQTKQKMLEALLAWLLKQSEQQCVCLTVEDLHWVDPSTLDVLSLLIDQLPTTRILLLLTFRPHFTPPWDLHASTLHFSLTRLPQPEVERIIHQVAGQKPLPDEIVQQLLDKTDGVPLFVEETTRMLIESEIVKEQDGRYELAVPSPALDIPSTLHDSLAARLDQLGPVKHTAQLAATLGREFSYEAMQAITSKDEDSLQQDLAYLVETGLLHRRGLPTQIQYMFKHALIQEAAYQSLRRTIRRQYHHHIARKYEAQFQEIQATQPEVLAHHYTEAGRHHQAAMYWQRAAQRALEAWAHTEAIAHANKGLTSVANLPDTPERARCELSLQIVLAVALKFTKGFVDEVGTICDRARSLCQQVGDMPQLFTMLRESWSFHLARSELARVDDLGKQLLQLAQHQNEPPLLVEAYRAISTSSFFTGDLDAADAYLHQGLKLHQPDLYDTSTIRYRQENTAAKYRSYTVWTLWLRGYASQSLQTGLQLVEMLQQYTDTYSRNFAYLTIAVLYQWRHEVDNLQTTLQAFSISSNPFFLEQTFQVILQGWISAQQGDYQQSIEQIKSGLEMYQESGAQLMRPYMLSLLAEIYGQSGHVSKGLEAIDEALLQAESTNEHWWEPELLRLKADLLLQHDVSHADHAEVILHQALEVARKQNAKALELRAAMSLYRLWQHREKHFEAIQLLSGLYHGFSEGYDTADLQAARHLLES